MGTLTRRTYLFVDNETKAYSPPQFSSNKSDLDNNNKEKVVEIEFSSFTPPSKIRQLSGDLGDEGPREGKILLWENTLN